MRAGRVATGALDAAAREALARFELPVGDVTRPVRELRLAERQVLEIVKTLLHEPRVLVLDEATSALLPEQVAWLFALVRRFAADGGCALFISHRMAEIEQLCDRVTVFRAGEDVGAGATAELPEEKLVELMLGRTVERIYPPKAPAAAAAPVVCELRGVGAPPRLRGVDLTLRRGELVGVGGLDGQGQAELFGALFGTVPMTGTVVLDGRELRCASPAQALDAGVALVPEDRAAEGLCLTLGVRDNVSLGNLRRISRLGLVDRGARARARRRGGQRAADQGRRRARPGRRPLGRQPAEGAARPRAGALAETAAALRRDARRRRRHQVRDLPADARAGRGRRRGAVLLQRRRRAGQPRRPRARAARRRRASAS